MTNMRQYIKDGITKPQNSIVLFTTKTIDGVEHKLQVLNPPHDMLIEQGWVEYVAPIVERKKSRMQVVQELVTKQWNERTDITNEEALDYMVIVYPFSTYIGKELPIGKIVAYNDKLWRVRQTHTAMEHYAPSMDTASLWEVIEKEHSGEVNDPILYTPPMEIFEGMYYTQDGVVYLCVRNSEVALAHDLSALLGIYVEVV